MLRVARPSKSEPSVNSRAGGTPSEAFLAAPLVAQRRTDAGGLREIGEPAVSPCSSGVAPVKEVVMALAVVEGNTALIAPRRCAGQRAAGAVRLEIVVASPSTIRKRRFVRRAVPKPAGS
jgi:hypothetical protein